MEDIHGEFSIAPNRGGTIVCLAILWNKRLEITPMPIPVSIVEDNDKLRGTLARWLTGRTFRCLSQYASARTR